MRGQALLSLVLFASVVASNRLQADGEIRWAADLQTARNLSAQFKVPLLVHFYGDNCLPCTMLEQRVFAKPELIETLNSYFICVKINASQDRQTAAEFQVHSWPTDVFLSPDGQTLMQGICQQDVTGYMNNLHNVAVMNRDRNLMLAANQDLQQARVNATLAAAQTGSPSTPAVAHDTTMAQNANGANLQQSSMYAQHAQQAASHANLQTSPAGLIAAPNSFAQPATAMPTGQSNVPNQYAANQLQGVAPSGYPQLTANVAPQAASYVSAQNQPNSGLPARANVSAGPVATSQQPLAIQSAGNPNDQRVMANAVPVSNTSLGPGLPARNTTGLTTASPSRTAGNGQASIQQYAAMPTMSQNGAAPQVAPQFQTASAKLGETESQTFNNPYFSSMNAQASAATPEPATMSASTTQGFVPRKPTGESERAGEGELTSALVAQPEASPVGAVDNTIPVTPSAVNVSSSTLDNILAVADEAEATEKKDLGLEGYCPVTLAASSEWVEGNSEFAVKHRGKVYWMSSQEAMEQFMADADAVTPVLSGYDPLVLLEEGRLVKGSIQFGLHEQISGKYLLFSSPESKKRYWSDFDRYSRALRVLMNKAGVK